MVGKHRCSFNNDHHGLGHYDFEIDEVATVAESVSVGACRSLEIIESSAKELERLSHYA